MRMVTKWPITNFPFKTMNPFGVIPAEAEVKFYGMHIKGNRKFYIVKWHNHYYDIYPEDVDIVFDEHDFDGNHLDFYCSHCAHHTYARLVILKRIPEEYDLTDQNQKEVILM